MKRSERSGFAVIALLGVAILVFGVVAAFYIVRNLRVVNTHRQNGEDVSIETPAGRLEIRGHEKLDPATLGVPVYPGAERTKDSGGASFEWTSSDGKEAKGVSVAGGELVTPDAASKVIEYYRTQLPNWLVSVERDGATHLELKDGGQKRIVVIHEKGDGTHIGIAVVGEPASN